MISVLFARSDSVYKTLLNVDVWDAERNALNYRESNVVIVHPPCRGWGRLRKFSKSTPAERQLAVFAVNQVRVNGGVLEHPASSSLWRAMRLPLPGEGKDYFGGWTLPVNQHSFGHRAEKKTWLYIVGCEPKNIPALPLILDKPTHCIRPTRSYPRLPSVTKPEREHTPIDFAHWLVSLANVCKYCVSSKEPEFKFNILDCAPIHPLGGVS